ncbi:c-type cytochrome [Dechloromonas denitrificans]|uniref:c-type cytochrome n=1 Tax=Dechloromonas denitrificans TaxID=281362 RepID=UPI001CF81677|nr:c-type cytochrome [Dechloromonas denitrificans]UCV01646.1 c-type cytochrome [Dechloromonas denitrificans]
MASPPPGLLIAALLSGLLSASAAEENRPGAEIYQGSCIICHSAGKHDAPRFGEHEAWQHRAEQGLDTLVPSAMAGLRKMPPMGANPALSDIELARAVIYMLNAVGSQFGEPTSAELKVWRGIADDRRKRR